MAATPDLVPARIAQVVLDELADSQTLVFTEINGDRILDMGIGAVEALAIQRSLRGETFPRPLTHDLLAITITALDGSLRTLRITGCDNGTYLAHLHIQAAHKEVEIDCRPSDGLALALRSPGCSIMIADHLLKSADQAPADEDLADLDEIDYDIPDEDDDDAWDDEPWDDEQEDSED